MDLNAIQKELTKRNIPFNRIRGRIDVTEVSGKAGLSGYWCEPKKFIFGFAVNDGELFSVIYRDDDWNPHNNDFVAYQTKVKCEPVEKMDDWWRVLNFPNKGEKVEPFVQRAFDWFEGFRAYLSKIAKEDCRRKLVKNIMNGIVNETANSLTNIKRHENGDEITVRGNLNDIPVKIGWHRVNYGKDFIIDLGIGKTHRRMTFTNKWGDGFSVKDFISRSFKAYEYAYLGKNPAEENEKNEK